MDDVSKVYLDEVRWLIEQGVPYIQLDNPHYRITSRSRRQQWRDIGIEPDVAILEDITGDNRTSPASTAPTSPLPPTSAVGTDAAHGTRKAVTIPSLNRCSAAWTWIRSCWSTTLTARAASSRCASYRRARTSCWASSPPSAPGTLESQDPLLRRIDEASKYVPMEHLSLSPQCGFASVDQGNLLTWDDQRRKLELVVDTARKAWG